MQADNNTPFRTILAIDSDDEKPVNESFYVPILDDADHELDEMRDFLRDVANRRQQEQQINAVDVETENVRHGIARVTLNDDERRRGAGGVANQQRQPQPQQRPQPRRHNNREAIQINLVDDEEDERPQQAPIVVHPDHGPVLLGIADMNGNPIDRRDFELENIRRQMHEQTIQHEQQMRELRELCREQVRQTQALTQAMQEYFQHAQPQPRQQQQPQPHPQPQPRPRPQQQEEDADRARKVVCLVGVFDIGDHREIGARLEACGYTYSATLTQRCTCLIRATSDDVSSQKVSLARAYGVPVYEAHHLDELLR